MAQSLSSVIIHVVFSTKNRHSWLVKPFRESVHAYMATTIREQERCECYRVGGVADHVHLAISLSRTISIADLILRVKTKSSKWIKAQQPELSQFAWQKGYGAFSISRRELPQLVGYINGQEEHHKKMTFQDEYRAFLIEEGVEFDERYVWD